jgi:hypothetical protein
MRPWTISLPAAIACALTLPATAGAGPRTDPGTSANADWAGPVFWPRAADDLMDYAFFPKGKGERFWAIGYGAILSSAAPGDQRMRRRLPSSSPSSNQDMPNKDLPNKDSGTIAATGTPGVAPGLAADADRCGSERAADSADHVIARIEQAISPSAPQREIVEQLRSALLRATDRINSACPTAAPATSMERLKAIQDRIWAMRDGLLTIRLPFERLYNSLTGDQDWRLARAGDSGEPAAKTETSDRRVQMCSEQASGIADWPMRAIGRALQPTEPQRASLEALRMRLSGVAQLIISSCPTYPLLGPMGRIAAASDRLDVMLFAVMTMSPALPEFYESLSSKQKVGLHRVIGQFRRSGQAGTGS